MTDRDLDRNVVTAAEYAELGPDFARRVGEPADVRNRPAGPPEVADDDLVLGELDKDGHGSGTSSPRATPSRPAWPDIPAGQLGRLPASGSRCRGSTAGSGVGLRTASS
jgi:hypothetical protein